MAAAQTAGDRWRTVRRPGMALILESFIGRKRVVVDTPWRMPKSRQMRIKFRLRNADPIGYTKCAMLRIGGQHAWKTRNNDGGRRQSLCGADPSGKASRSE